MQVLINTTLLDVFEISDEYLWCIHPYPDGPNTLTSIWYKIPLKTVGLRFFRRGAGVGSSGSSIGSSDPSKLFYFSKSAAKQAGYGTNEMISSSDQKNNTFAKLNAYKNWRQTLYMGIQFLP